VKILQINSTSNSGSTGRIAENIGKVFLGRKNESAIAFGRKGNPSASQEIKIGTRVDFYTHAIQTRILDNHGLASVKATKNLIEDIKKFDPDVIGLHNLHGYYLNYKTLFEYLKKARKPVVWTFHDCWPFTGHCSYFDRVDCEKWKTHCDKCPLTHYYPASYFKDRSYKNFDDKRECFSNHPNLTIVTPSNWLKELVKESFLKDYDVEVIHNGVDLTTFYPKKITMEEKVVLGVANVWSERKGLNDFIKLREILDSDIHIVLIGLNSHQVKNLPEGILGLDRTESAEDLASWYNKATVFCNPTYIDNFPTTNIEALACGTKVITYDTGGSPEAVCDKTGYVLQKGDIVGMKKAIESEVKSKETVILCRARAKNLFDAQERFDDYYKLYLAKLKSN